MSASHHQSRRQLFHFNPFEVGFCNLRRIDRTPVIVPILDAFSQKHKVGFVKYNDTALGQVDLFGYTIRVRDVGSRTLLLRHENPTFSIQFNARTDLISSAELLACDLVFMEDVRDVKMPQLLLIDRATSPFEIREQANAEQVIATIGETKQRPDGLPDVPYFEATHLEQAIRFLHDYFDERVRQVPLYGLILSGGRSTRMKRDKAALTYHDKPQTQHVKDLIQPFCESVFLSCRADQADAAAYRDFQQIHDVYLEMGPMGGILSAMTRYPAAAWLVVATDLPFLSRELLTQLTREREPFKYATAFINPASNFPEPMCAIYEPKSYPRLLQFLGRGYVCPRKMLINSDIQALQPVDARALTNVNHPREYEQARQAIEQPQEETE